MIGLSLLGFRRAWGKIIGSPSGSAGLLSKKPRIEQSVRDLDHYFGFTDIQG